MTAKLTVLRQAYSTFTQVETSVTNIIAQLSSVDTIPGMGEVLGTIKDLEEQEWPTKLAKAGEQLEEVCMAAAILPLPLLKLVTAQAGTAGPLISQYKSTLDKLRSSQKEVREILEPHPTIQYSPQNIPLMSSFSSTDK